MKRSGMATAKLSATRASTTVHTAAAAAPAASRRCDGMRSARFRVAEATAPTTKPICTEAVSHTAPPAVSPQSVRRLGTTADMENHTARPSTCTAAIAPRCTMMFTNTSPGPSPCSAGPACGGRSPTLMGPGRVRTPAQPGARQRDAPSRHPWPPRAGQSLRCAARVPSVRGRSASGSRLRFLLIPAEGVAQPCCLGHQTGLAAAARCRGEPGRFR